LPEKDLPGPGIPDREFVASTNCLRKICQAPGSMMEEYADSMRSDLCRANLSPDAGPVINSILSVEKFG